ncbi:CRE-PAR-2 protein [Caenorhabditis remanei]|uniref:CRE-PAR-2 protein n=2 Tax=Caenorhabditis remanei TaxID=31234 RepID=E3MSI0_CAERE|nr:CRE-PAR-2 protein [Caenorhabditis remanei]
MARNRRLLVVILSVCLPINPHRRRPLPPSARPTKSSLKLPPDASNFFQSTSSPESNTSGGDYCRRQRHDDSIIAGAASLQFRRNGFGRRSERFTSSTSSGIQMMMMEMSDLEEEIEENSSMILKLTSSKKKDSDDADGTQKLKRNSFFRRSLNAFRSKTGVRGVRGTKVSDISTIPEDSEALLGDSEGEEPEDSKNDKNDKNAKKSNMKSIWRRLFLSKKSEKSEKSSQKSEKSEAPPIQLLRHEHLKDETSFSTTFIRLENQHDDPRYTEHVKNSAHFAFGYYMGIGRKFERVAGGSEITLVVFGHAMAGKTTFVRSIRQLFLVGTDRIRVIPLAERYRLAGIGMMPYPVGDNRLPHVVSLVINNDDVEYVLDIIDPEYDNSNLPQAYMDACDAAYLLIDTRNSASHLSTRQILRNMKSARHTQCEILMNIPSESCGQPRVVSSDDMEIIMLKKSAPIRELCVNELDRSGVEQMLLSMCERVSTARKSTIPITSSATSSPTITQV